jgi:AraC-like DNA-binding protein
VFACFRRKLVSQIEGSDEVLHRMANSIPLIRSAALFPMIRWLRANDRPVQERLHATDLGYVSEDAPEVPIPLLAVLEFFRNMGALEGPDIGARVVTTDSLADLGTFGRAILGGSTPRTALQCAVSALPRYSTHEVVTLRRIPGGLCVQVGWSRAIDDETMHITQQFTAMLVQALCAATGVTNASPRSVRIRPHPRFGLDHLRPFFGPALDVAKEATLDIDLNDDVLDAPLRLGGTLTGVRPPQDWAVLKGDSSFSHSARLVLKSMAGDPPVSIERLSRAAGMSVRSLQRALTSEGTSFRRLSDDVRRGRAMGILPADHGTLSSVATDLGYSAQSSLSRAVRRWTGASPKKLTQATK